MSRAKRRAWHEAMMRRMKSGENDVSLMWCMPVCNGRVCRERWCHGDHYIGAVPVFHGGTP